MSIVEHAIASTKSNLTFGARPLVVSHPIISYHILSATFQYTSTMSSGFPPSSSQPSTMASSQTQPLSNNGSSNDSQATTILTESDRVFTPPGSDSEASTGHGRGNNHSSQDSQLMQLSQLAAARERMAEVDNSAAAGLGGPSKKRMADGEVKHTRGGSNVSPVRMGHSRNTSAVSVASTTGSRIGEVG